MSAIVSILSHNNGIGWKGGLCVSLSEDLKRFKKLTTGEGPCMNLVVMGYNTYKSLPVFPLPNRHNIVITRLHLSSLESRQIPHVTALASFVELEDYLLRFKGRYNEVWFIGGASIYKEAIARGLVKYVYATEIECANNVPADVFFDKTLLHNAQVLYTHSVGDGNVHALQKTYLLARNDEEGSYLKLLQKLLLQPLRTSRSGRTRALFAETLKFDLHKNGFPLLTTKRMPAKSQTIEKELLFFIRGQTDATLLQEQGVHICDGNTTAEFLKDKALEKNDMGPLYGFVWRHFGAAYATCKTDYSGKGIDQLKQLVLSLRTLPASRRHLMTSYDPSSAPKGCLWPCHSIIIQCFVRDGFLDLIQYQRSADAFLGLPFNIASSALLLLLLAQQTNLLPGRLTLYLGDVHLYEEHEEVAKKQLERNPLPFPKYNIEAQDDIGKYKLEHFHLHNYRSYGRLRASMAV
jgi:thymidylate synthase